MSEYKRLIEEIFLKNHAKAEKEEISINTVLENVTRMTENNSEIREDTINKEIMSKLENYKQNIPLLELLFMDASKRNKVEMNNIKDNLSKLEKEKILTLVIDFIEQFESMDLTQKTEENEETE